MLTLHEQQQQFISALFEKDAVPLSIVARFPSEQFHVYRESAWASCRYALSVTFPYVWKEWSQKEIIPLEHLVNRFLCYPENWPQTGCFDDWGSTFPHFLSEQANLAEASYWKALGNYEWLCHRASIAAQEPLLLSEHLTGRREEEQLNYRFVFQPYFFLYHTVHSIDKYPAGWLAIYRTHHGLCIQSLQEDTVCFIQHLKAGASLSEAYDAATALHAHFDLAATLALLLEGQWCQKHIGCD